MHGPSRQPVVRNLLGGLLALVALNAFGGGFYGLTGAKSIPREWLEGSPFRSYLIPSLVLFGPLAACFSLAAIAVFTRHKFARALSMVAALLLAAWIVAETLFIGYRSWLQPAMAVIAAVLFGLSLLWKNSQS